MTDEIWLLRADDPTAELRIVEPRCEGVGNSWLYHHQGQMLVLTNVDAEKLLPHAGAGRVAGPGQLGSVH
ncbi:MAG: hypothetical protein R2706_09145 [Acidimicrobiales bacterium]